MEKLLSAIADKSNTRIDIALLYASLIIQENKKETPEVDWRKINQAIMNRWSRSAMDYIKDRAWKIVESKK